MTKTIFSAASCHHSEYIFQKERCIPILQLLPDYVNRLLLQMHFVQPKNSENHFMEKKCKSKEIVIDELYVFLCI